MKKINIVKNNIEFNKIINTGKVYKNRYFSIYILEKNKKYYRFGIAVSKKTGNAVTRNKIKRQIRNIISNSNINYDFFDYVIIARKEILNINYQLIEKELLKLLSNINKENYNE